MTGPDGHDVLLRAAGGLQSPVLVIIAQCRRIFHNGFMRSWRKRVAQYYIRGGDPGQKRLFVFARACPVVDPSEQVERRRGLLLLRFTCHQQKS